MLKIGLIVDHPKRDLDGIIRIACALIEKRVCVYIIPLYYQGVDVPLLDLDVILINYARPINLELVKGYFKQKISIFVLDTEGGILSETGANSLENLTNYVSKSGYSRLLSGYLFWGNHLFNAFSKKKILKKEKMHITGCPRFDFASKDLRHLLTYKDSNFILVNANFSLVNPSFVKNDKKEIEVLIKSGWNRLYVNKMVADQRLIMKNFLNTIRDLALTFPHRKFLIRPHPFENKKVYDDYFSDFYNVTVDGNGNVLNVIKNSAFLLHLNCGTSIEAIMLKRLPVSMEFLNTPHMTKHSKLPSKVSLKATSIKDLKNIIKNIEEAYKRFRFDSVYQSHINRFFYINDGYSGNRVANILFKQGYKKARVNKIKSILWSLKNSRLKTGVFQKCQGVTANLLGSLYLSYIRNIFNYSRKEKDIDIKYVKKLASTLSPKISDYLEITYSRHPLSALPLATITIKLNSFN